MPPYPKTHSLVTLATRLFPNYQQLRLRKMKLIEIKGNHPLAGPPANGFYSLPVRAPKSDHLSMPAEWEEHDACWMVWPCSEECFGNALEDAKAAYTKVAEAISACEHVSMLVNSDQRQEAENMCGHCATLIDARSCDSWARDSAPTFVRDAQGMVAGIDWLFTGWGHHPIVDVTDENMAMDILSHLKMRRYVAPLILEGGSFHVDGEGTLITTKQCLLDQKRNAGLSENHFEQYFDAYLGIKKVIWLNNGLDGDLTTGHVDILANFARPGTILLHQCTDVDDPNYAICKDAEQRIRNVVDAQGRQLELIHFPQPQARYHHGERLDLSYINFYMANDAIIMSSFDDPADQKAYEIMQSVFPQRRIIQIPSMPIFMGGGGIHCITQQQPKGVALAPF